MINIYCRECLGINCIFSGYQTRAMIKIGDIKYIQRITSAGHCFTFFDEENKMITPKILLSASRFSGFCHLNSEEMCTIYDTRSVTQL